MRDRCEVPGCQGAIELIYLDREICWNHWTQLTADGVPATELRMALGLGPGAPDAMKETEMARKKKADTAATAEADPVEQAPPAKPKAPQKPRTKGRRATAEKTTETAEAAPATEVAEAAQTPPRAADEPKAARMRKPKADKPPKEDLVVFAFRLTQAERDAIHQTAGPRNATQFVRRVAVAFAREDKGAFETVIQEARRLRR